MAITTQKKQKLNNQKSLLRIIRSEDKISQALLSVKTGLQPSTVSYLIRELKEKGLLGVAGKGESGESGGKKSSLLSFISSHGVFSGISVKKEQIIFSLFDFCGSRIGQTELNTAGYSYSDISQAIVSEINSNFTKYANYKGVCIAVSSVVNEKGDIVYSYGSSLKVSHFYADIIKDIPKLPLMIENDANCAAYYANFFLKEKYRNIITYSIYLQPFCMGAGIILNNMLYKGNIGAAGEIWGSLAGVNDAFNRIGPNDFNKWREDPVAKSFLGTLQNFILSTAVFLDTEAIVICGDMTGIDRAILVDFKNELNKTFNHFIIEIIDGQDIALTGAALLSIDLYINTLLNAH